MSKMRHASTDIVDDGRLKVPVRQFSLRVMAGPDGGATHTSAGERVAIGTERGADLVLTDPAVSRFHCEIVVAEEQALVQDLGSRNGTFVEGVSVLSAHLHDGATLGLGRSRVRFELCPEHVGILLSDEERVGSMIGRSAAMRASFALLERAARTEATVLLQGETGTGKDLAAESIHMLGDRRNGPLVVVDCGAIPPGLLESELFGHERGAFTGATAARVGALETAHGWTLFLDEIGELAPDLQPKLLRALDTHTSQRVGSNLRVEADFRLVAATNRDLRVEVNAGRFRSDLYYRLAVLVVRLPPLRERTDDLPRLVEQFVAAAGGSPAQAAAFLGDASHLEALLRHRWPGNVRELRNYVQQCLVLGDVARPTLEAPDDLAAPIDPTMPLREARDRWLQAFERRYLLEVLRRNGNNVTAAARAAGVNRVYFHKLLSRCGIPR
ncbi:MAG: sigma 54-dependent Fis family transcriptional regulator [Deltaproteobacteria bacterium]|nr:sigma 54-dependent Fis family transcriptional regulator [Deltaproteobacteria bacterium]